MFLGDGVLWLIGEFRGAFETYELEHDEWCVYPKLWGSQMRRAMGSGKRIWG